MVGVAGKSKACRNCKSRRVKCGHERPSCCRCGKAGLTCLGYEKDAMVFVNRTLESPSTTALDVIAGTKPSHILSSSLGVVDVSSEYRVLSYMIRCPHYSLNDFRSRVFRISRQLYLPREKFVDKSVGIASLSWFESICRIDDQCPTLDLSLLAFCAAQLYVTHHGGITLDGALQVYSVGLARLSTALQHAHSTNLVCILASIVVLSTCELFICPSDAGWRAHVHGIAEVLRLHEAFSHHNHDARDWSRLCARARMITILTELMSRRKGSMTPHQWREIMSTRIEHDSLDDLLDIVHDLPAVLELTSASYHRITAIAAILTRIRAWEGTFQKCGNRPLYTFVSPHMHNPADDGYAETLYENVLELRSLLVARCLLICWSTTVQVIDSVVRWCNGNEDFKDTTQDLKKICLLLDPCTQIGGSVLEMITAEANKYARLICQSVEYMYHTEMGLVGPQCMVYARWVVGQHYQQLGMARELSWCQNIPNMTGAESLCGIRTMTFQD